jgi:ribosomal protein S18 acetylase RimI-like enzyme
MTELTNENGVICARIDILPEDGEAWAIVVSWKKDVDGIPDTQAWSDAIELILAQCKEKGATIIDSRVITRSEGVDETLVAARAEMHRDSLFARGFKQGEGRVEYRMALDQALAALEARKITAGLAWNCVDTGTESELVRAAGFFHQAAEGDPSAHPDDDTLGFLKTFLEDEDAVSARERLQIGTSEGVPAAVLALKVDPSDGWSTVYYLGVLPAFRGRGFGAEAMLHAFRCLKTIGGKTYHDGTGANNAAARSLFARLSKLPFRVMEEWRLGK